MLDKKTIVQSAEIPSVPEILQKILMLAEDPRASAQQLEELIIQEPGLVTHLLKMVNSAFYARAQKVDSIRQTIVILGMNTVRSIVSGLVLINSFHNLKGVPESYVHTVFQHSILCANMMNVLAGKEPVRRRDPLYLAGMVHDIGHLILGQYFKDKYMSVTHGDPFPSVDEEKNLFEMDHSELGSELLDEWKFPDDVVMMVRCHHNSGDYNVDENDISYLKACDALSERTGELDTFLSQDEARVDAVFSDLLADIGWSWPMLQENREKISQAVELA